MFHELDIALENLPALVLHFLEYMSNEAHLRRREKAEGFLTALLHPLLSSRQLFFAIFYSGLSQVDAVRVLMNVMCTQLLHTRHHIIPGEWKESFGVELERSSITGSRFKFLRTLVEYVQAHFNEF